jgi:3-deoxy-D-manno-octulosonic-acid transferase
MPGVIGAAWAVGTTLGAPALRVMLRRRVARGKEIAARLPEREGIDPAPRPDGRLLWLHAASVGESQSILPVIDHLVQEPGLTVLVTTGTVTSATLLANQTGRFPAGHVLHRFVPLDVPAWAARFLDHWRPDAAAFVESELWPNLLTACRRRGVKLMLVNGRMSARSMRGWARAPGFARAVMQSFERVHPQSVADGERLLALGARTLEPAGNLKLAAPPLPADPAILAGLKRTVGDRPIWLAASTHPGEEDVAVEVHRILAPSHPRLLTVLAPRHPERGVALAASILAPRRSAGEGPVAAGIWIADTMGELGLLYRLARVVFMGKSLAGQAGGQNPLEPARLGCAIATGPATANFADSVQRLQDAGGLTVVADGTALATWVDAMLCDPDARRAAGEAAQRASSGESDLPARIAASLLDLVNQP